ncbi:hypothetical protein G6321_00028245 [Bradyrhizobium barranii subsp. barranii]|uniref:Uncharacterized protein n=1 Tax=Bradyrhizobium barranii subsp. barranii TaxID=2823807 RepID=A0A7Z0QH94_9BRAD|nr:hypothetical protein G6321_00028245 [Bradyrhizobium barranii subsp. barranii]
MPPPPGPPPPKMPPPPLPPPLPPRPPPPRNVLVVALPPFALLLAKLTLLSVTSADWLTNSAPPAPMPPPAPLPPPWARPADRMTLLIAT